MGSDENAQQGVTKRTEKAILRTQMRALRDQFSSQEKVLADAMIAKRLFAMPFYLEAQTVLAYLSFLNEVGTDTLIQKALRAGKRIAAPVTKRGEPLMKAYRMFDLDNVQMGEWGMREPVATDQGITPDEFDLILVPGLAFTRTGDRLGYGGGYYDRYLAKVRPSTICVGLAYDFQVIPSLTVESFDFRLDYVLTPTSTIHCMVK